MGDSDVSLNSSPVGWIDINMLDDSEEPQKVNLKRGNAN